MVSGFDLRFAGLGRPHCSVQGEAYLQPREDLSAPTVLFVLFCLAYSTLVNCAYGFVLVFDHPLFNHKAYSEKAISLSLSLIKTIWFYLV